MTDFKELIELNKRKGESNLRFYAICLAVFLWLTAFIGANRYFFYYIEVDGPSMEDTLHTGDVLCMNRRERASYGDVVVVDGEKIKMVDGNIVYDEERNVVYELLIKRVIAMEGDTLVIEGGYVYRNGEKLKEDYVKEQGKTYVNNSPARWETTIPAGEVFFMGDNRAVSKDSRSSDFGTCKEEQIVGVVSRWAMSGAVKWFTGLRADISAWIANLFR